MFKYACGDRKMKKGENIQKIILCSLQGISLPAYKGPPCWLIPMSYLDAS